jgi:hypothetical protein
MARWREHSCSSHLLIMLLYIGHLMQLTNNEWQIFSYESGIQE